MRNKIYTCNRLGCTQFNREVKNPPTNAWFPEDRLGNKIPKCISCKGLLQFVREDVASEGETVAVGAVVGAAIGGILGGPAGFVLGGLIGSAIGKANAEEEKKKRFFGGYR